MRRLREFLAEPVPFWHVVVVACASTVGVLLAGWVR